ncbi:predicted coding region AF_1236 [Archaeoglobus fulgidus DSM 4304]|uniref:Uncharacterized protein AF_1236 n=1 Tax=Archaeoglobus fulgidus (strain ATCC 49558 / DSM 4304 / JCM 9628 / NBRC 100126 / VC-16) TaxID=224325 RepID=Y1236_ARCFU|nr:RecName: Full=Uncharacterized protein AF_1236 [Archaeoglobus fulgidus DSM 4304]AAB90019.1 predicted coding region AF_1236 [Archaeoglobus fulgidus DSM 4304]
MAVEAEQCLFLGLDSVVDLHVSHVKNRLARFVGHSSVLCPSCHRHGYVSSCKGNSSLYWNGDPILLAVGDYCNMNFERVNLCIAILLRGCGLHVVNCSNNLSTSCLDLRSLILSSDLLHDLTYWNWLNRCREDVNLPISVVPGVAGLEVVEEVPLAVIATFRVRNRELPPLLLG